MAVGAALVAPLSADAANWSAATHTVVAGNFDGDVTGRDDLLVIARDSGGVSGILLTTSAGIGQPHQTWPSDYLGIPWADELVRPVIGNFNENSGVNDTRDDVFLQRAIPGLHYLSHTDSDFKLTAKTQTFGNGHLGQRWSLRESRIISGDFNGDGNAELYLQPKSRDTNSAVMAASNTTGRFESGAAKTWSNSFGGLKWSTADSIVHAGDFNGDGRADLLVQAKPTMVPVLGPLVTSGGWPVVAPINRHFADSFGIAWGLSGASIDFHSSTVKWSRLDNGADWSTSRYIVHVGRFDDNVTDDVFLQPRRFGDPAYVVLFSPCTAPCAVTRTVRTVADPSSGSWAETEGALTLGTFSANQYGRTQIFFLPATTAGVSKIIELDTSGSGPVSIGNSTDFTEPTLQLGGGAFTGSPGTAAGGILGEFSVGPTGAAAYKIPVAVPPGVAGMQPELALTYSSQGANSFIGVGWSLSGLSTISMCAKTFAQDGIPTGGVADGVDLDEDDRYCLDGGRLLPRAGSEFRTEVESYQRVTRVGSQGANGHPASFVVEDKAGLKRTYGIYNGQNDGLVLANGTSEPLTYAIKHVQDGFGNFIDFDYLQDSGTPSSFAPANVKWGNGTTVVASVGFEYETRSDPTTGFVAGRALGNNKRLTRIVVYGTGTTRVRELTLQYGYSPTTNRSLLRQVTECERRSNTCLAATTFDWQAGARGFTNHKYYPPVTRASQQLLDVDGNGIVDYVVNHNGSWYTRLNNPNGSGGYSASVKDDNWVTGDFDGDGYGDLLQQRSDGYLELLRGGNLTDDDKFHPAQVPGSFQVADGSWNNAVAADINADGRDDLVYWHGGTLFARLSEGATFSSTLITRSVVGALPLDEAPCTGIGSYVSTAGLFPVQFDSDGRADIMLIRGTGSFCENGQGYYGRDRYRLQVYSFDGTDFVLRTQYPSAEQYDSIPWQGIKIVDVNGDGLSDVLHAGENDFATWTVLVSNGANFAQAWHASYGGVSVPLCADGESSQIYFGAVATGDYQPQACYGSARSYTSTNISYTAGKLSKSVILDYNQDGRTDVLVYNGGNNRWKALIAYNNGYSSYAFDTGAEVENYEAGNFALDVGGDGIPDIVSRGTSDEAYYVQHARGPTPDLLNLVNNGLTTQSVQVQYSTLTDTGTYLGRADHWSSVGLTTAAPAFPYAHFSAPMVVVKKYKVPDGNGNYIDTQYRYRGAKSHRQGYGFAGFSEVLAWNDNAATETTNRYLQTFPFTGLLKAALTRAPDHTSTVLAGGGASVLLQWQEACQGVGGNDSSPVHPDCWFMAPGTQTPSPISPPFLTSETANDYGNRDMASHGGAVGSRWPYLSKSEEKRYPLPTTIPAPVTQPAVHRTTTVEYSSYDDYGNARKIVATVKDGAGGNLHTTDTEHHYENWVSASQWCLSRLESTRVKQTRVAYSDTVTPVDAIRVSRFAYNPTHCLLTSETTEPDNYTTYQGAVVDNPNNANGGQTSHLKLTKTYGYDASGNRTSETISGYGIASRTTTSDYGGSPRRFLQSSTNALGHQESHTWDPNLGARLTTTGPNGLTTRWLYDGFGRVTSEIAPGGTVVKDTSYQKCSVAGCSAAGANYKVTETLSSGTRTVVEYDGLRREILRQATAATGADVFVQRAYDPLGREFRISAPYRSGQNICWTVRKFDFQSRVIREWSPTSSNNPSASNCMGGSPPAYNAALPGGGRLRSIIYDVVVNGHIETTTSDAGRSVTRVTNVEDRLLELYENPAGTRVSTYYDYDANGNNTWIKDPDGFITTVRFNAVGQKTELASPDLGTWSYEYNVLGELTGQLDARVEAGTGRWKICQYYDDLGRMTQRIERCELAVGSTNRRITDWIFDVANGAGKGKLYRAIGPYTTDPNGVGQATAKYQETYDYDERGRVKQIVRRQGQATLFYFWRTFDYDDQNRVVRQYYPASAEDATATFAGSKRFGVVNEYNEAGALYKVKNLAGTATYWTLNGTDALGNVTNFVLGNAISTLRIYDPATGYLIENSSTAAATFQMERYEWDARGNLLKRRDQENAGGAWKDETLTYDGFDRLDTVTVSAGSLNEQYNTDYSNAGRITLKESSNGGDYTNYLYGTANTAGNATDAGPHAVRQVTANGVVRTYQYDNNGNLTATTGARTQILGWTAGNQLETLIEGSNQTTFNYGADGARYRKYTLESCSGCGCTQPTTTTFYVGDSFEHITSHTSGTTEYRHYVRVGSAIVAVHVEWSSGSSSDSYLHHDHLGSVVAITNSSAVLLQRMSYDPWGKRRSTAWQVAPAGGMLAVNNLWVTNRGFTSHEMLDNHGLIHMNGRVYDPEIGRFLSADPYVQFPESTQGLDRYTYVNNNPLSYTDPSGHFIWFLAAVIVGKLAAVELVGAMVLAAIAGYLETGTLKGALFGAISAGLAVGVGALFQIGGNLATALGGALDWVQAAAHGLVQGAIAAAQGGDFGAAFAAGFVSSRFASKASDGSTRTDVRIKNVIKAAVVGGTASKIGGGKFANGAISAAFVHAFGPRQGSDVVTTGDGRGGQDGAIVEPEFLADGGLPLSVHDSLDAALQAGEDAARAAQAVSGTNNEFGVATIKGHVTAEGVQTYYNSAPVTSGSPNAIHWSVGRYGTLVALNHSHPNSLGFSSADRGAYRQLSSSGNFPEFRGVYMFDARGNHWYGPKSPGLFGGRTHSCGGRSATTWSCPAF